jgi:hypothetical protein
LGANCKIDLQHAIVTAKLLRLWNHAPRPRSLTETHCPIRARRGTKLLGGGTRSEPGSEKAHSQKPLFHANSRSGASPHR